MTSQPQTEAEHRPGLARPWSLCCSTAQQALGVDALSQRRFPETSSPGVLRLRLLFNTGAAFSRFSRPPPCLGLVSFVGWRSDLVIWHPTQSCPCAWQALGVAALLGAPCGPMASIAGGGRVVVDFARSVADPVPRCSTWADVAINLAVLSALDFLGGTAPCCGR